MLESGSALEGASLKQVYCYSRGSESVSEWHQVCSFLALLVGGGKCCSRRLTVILIGPFAQLWLTSLWG